MKLLRLALAILALSPSAAFPQALIGDTSGSAQIQALQRHTSGFVNVREPPYNAKGDGVSDDTSALQAAVNAAGASGAEVFVPPVARGAYYMFSRLYFQYDAVNNPGFPPGSTQARPITLRGAGPHSGVGTYLQSDFARSVLVSTDATGPALVIDGGAAYSARRVVIEGLTVVASNSSFVARVRNANDGSELRHLLLQQNGAGGGIDWETTWMMGLEDVTVQAGASSTTVGSVGLRLRCNGAGGGPIWAHKVTVAQAYQQRTTGDITSGTNSLVVASAIDFAEGQEILVQGAGANGDWLDTTISHVGGTTLTLADPAGTSVSGAPVRHGGGFDVGIQVGALAAETGYDYYFSAVDFRDVVSQWNRTGIVIGGRPSAATFSHLWLEGNRQRGFFVTNRATNVTIAHAYLNDLRTSEGEIVIDSATSGTKMVGLTIENVWMARIHQYGVRFLDGTYTTGRIASSRFTKDQADPAGAGIGVYTGGHATPWALEDNDFDTWSGLTAYDSPGALGYRRERTGVASSSTLDAPGVTNVGGASSVAVTGRSADASNAVGVVVDNATTLTASGTKALSIRNGGTEKAAFNKDGSLSIGTSMYVGTTSIGLTGPVYQSATNASAMLRGNRDAGNANADVILNSTNTRTAGKLVSVQNNGSEKAYFDASGNPACPNLPTYADNAAALTGGLVAGQFYRTATGVLMVVY